MPESLLYIYIVSAGVKISYMDIGMEYINDALKIF